MSHVAFRCKSCSHLERPEHAGDNDIPHACSVCGAGVEFDRRSGLKTAKPDNWEILADASPERLQALGLTAEQCKRHKGKVKNAPGVIPGKKVSAHGIG